MWKAASLPEKLTGSTKGTIQAPLNVSIAFRGPFNRLGLSLKALSCKWKEQQGIAMVPGNQIRPLWGGKHFMTREKFTPSLHVYLTRPRPAGYPSNSPYPRHLRGNVLIQGM